MESLPRGGDSGSLEAILCRLVGDPSRIRGLHELLGPFCHQSRNLLNSLKMSLYLTRRSEPGLACPRWANLEGRYARIETLYDRLQFICRPMKPSCVRLSLRLLFDERRRVWQEIYASSGRELRLKGPSAIGQDVGDFDPNLLGRALDALVEWRAEAVDTETDAQLSWDAEGDRLSIGWREYARLDHARACPRSITLGEPWASGCSVSEADAEPSLALPTLARVMAAHGGTMSLIEPRDDASTSWGLHLSWPRTVTTHLS